MSLGEQTGVVLVFACSPGLLAAIELDGNGATAVLPGTAIAAAAPPSETSTMELLLDVELPVSVSFGSAQLPLKDVLKLTSGSIVELDRSISEPVEVIINNCVIARGEVVVVEGNYGVRIQQIISRRERLQTIP
jgi:flagellar motor switch protein FliN/FliY